MKLFDDQHRLDPKIVNSCGHADCVDPCAIGYYGYYESPDFPRAALLGLVRQNIHNFSVIGKTGTQSFDDNTLEMFQCNDGFIWLAKALADISTYCNIDTPVVTDISLSSSTFEPYAADHWHRDGIIGKRIKVFIILYADDNAAQLEFVPDSGNLTTTPKNFETLTRSGDIDNIMEYSIREYYGTDSTSITSYKTGSVFYFDTNMLHRRKPKGGEPGLLDRLAIVVEIIDRKRLAYVDRLGPIGKRRLTLRYHKRE